MKLLVVFLAKTTMVFGSSVVYNECTSPECSGVVVTDLSLFSLRVHDQCAVLASPLRLVFISPPRLSLAFSSTVINFGTSWEECRGFSEDGEGGVLAGGCVGGGLVCVCVCVCVCVGNEMTTEQNLRCL